MYGPERDLPLPGCVHMLDSLDGVARHARHRANLFIAAKSPITRLEARARARGWNHLKFLSSAGSDYDRDYFGDSRGLAGLMRKQQDFKDGEEWDMPMINVFHRVDGRVWHFWGQEKGGPQVEGVEQRHNSTAKPAIPDRVIRSKRSQRHLQVWTVTINATESIATAKTLAYG